MDNFSSGKNSPAFPRHKVCERCGTGFECRAGDIPNCECNGIEITGKEIDYSKAKYRDCLCVNCLREIGQTYQLPTNE